jgi:hypothetical protein
LEPGELMRNWLHGLAQPASGRITLSFFRCR